LVTGERGMVGVETSLGVVSRVNILATVVDKFDRSAGGTRMEGEGRYAALTLDDGTGVIRVKAWGDLSEKLAQIKVGDLVLVIGRIRSFQDETYIHGEIVRRVEDPNWETVRLLELALQRLEPRPLVGFEAAAEASPPSGETERASEPTLAPEPQGAQPAGQPQQEVGVLAPSGWERGDSKLVEPVAPEPPEEPGEGEPTDLTKLRRIVLQTIEKYDKEGGARFEQIMEAASGASEEDVEQVLIDLLSEGLVYEPEIHRYRKS